MSETPPDAHWASHSERGNALALTLTVWIVRYAPGWVIQGVVMLVTLYYYATSAQTRAHIQRYQTRLREAFPEVMLPARFSVLRQFFAFAASIADRFAVWQKRLGLKDVVVHRDAEMQALMRDPKPGNRGQLLLCSHLGTTEITRALGEQIPQFKINMLVHTRHAQAFNEALKKSGANDLRLLQVSELDAATMLMLHERIDAGEWIAIAADRVPVRGEKSASVNFLGHSTLFAQGPWLLSGLLNAPVNTLFCIREQGKYQLYFDRFSPALVWNRRNRQAVIAQAMQAYADRLAAFCAKAPLQWFNFFDFWQEGDESQR